MYAPPRHSFRSLLGWGLSAVWVLVVGWGFWQTEARPLWQRFSATAETQARITNLETWFRATSRFPSGARAILIVEDSAACACDTDETTTTEWIDLRAQGLQIIQTKDLPGFPVQHDERAALTLFSAQGRLLYAGPAVLSDTCGSLSLPDLLRRGLQINEPPFGTPIVHSRCDCQSNHV